MAHSKCLQFVCKCQRISERLCNFLEADGFAMEVAIVHRLRNREGTGADFNNRYQRTGRGSHAHRSREGGQGRTAQREMLCRAAEQLACSFALLAGRFDFVDVGQESTLAQGAWPTVEHRILADYIDQVLRRLEAPPENGESVSDVRRGDPIAV